MCQRFTRQLRQKDSFGASQRAAREFAKSGSPYEKRYGFSRGVRHGNHVEIAGTAPIPAEGEELGVTAYDQVMRCGIIAIGALEDLGAAATDVIRTTMYITDASDADEIGRAHHELFADAAQASTMVEAWAASGCSNHNGKSSSRFPRY